MPLVNTALLREPWNWAVIIGFALFWLMLIAVLFPQQTGANNASSNAG